MTRDFIVDASIGIAWVHPAQATSGSQALLQALCDGAVVRAPALWPLETANALLVLVRRGKLTEEERGTALSALAQLSVALDHEMASLAFTRLSALASQHGLSIYDAGTAGRDVGTSVPTSGPGSTQCYARADRER